MYPLDKTAEDQRQQPGRCSTSVPAALGLIALSAVLALGAIALPAKAQDAMPEDEAAAASYDTFMLEDVVVTAQKRSQPVQDVPLSITAFDAEQIDALKVRDLSNLSINMPNVTLDDVGTARGIANFSIRGLGINSSIPSIDPTVGVFVDGIYIGTNAAVLYDTFDLESIEVLRGPQGVLFGRNVVGGAVLLNTKTPTDRYEATIRSSVEGGGKAPNVYVAGTLNAPLTDTLAARFTVYSNQDQGWFENEHDDRAFGAQDTLMLRPVVSWQPTENLDLTLRYEYQEIDGDGPAAQNHTNGSGLSNPFANFDRDSFDFAVNEEGYIKSEVHFFNARLDWRVPLGHGTVTNIFGWRDAQGEALSDIDATPLSLFHGGADQVAEQFSNELRYSGLFLDKLFLTTGFYYFQNDIGYHEQRNLAFGTILQNGGGDYEVETFGLFMNADYDLTERLTLTAGLRWTHEEKEAEVTNLTLNTGTVCHIIRGPACPSHFKDEESWNNLSPKIGLTYRFDDDTLAYAHWTRGFRSGGYNLRNTAINLPGGETFGPGPFDEEQVDTFEVGFKSTIGGRARLNAAFFFNLIDDLQRELVFTETFPIVRDGVVTMQENIVQEIRNTADAEMWGFEVEGSFALTPSLVLLSSAGFVETDYTKVKFDLNRDGQVNGRDQALEPPRAPRWTYSMGLLHTLRFGNRYRLASRVNYAYRDKWYDSDDNLGFNRQQKMLDAGLDLHINNSQWVIGLYGRNLLDHTRFGGDTQLPARLGGGTFSPLAKGRTFGLELTYNFVGA
jgi:iron complex outermembrane receptor protein